MRQIFALLLALLLCLAATGAALAEGDGARLVVSGLEETQERVKVTVSLADNPGIAFLKVYLAYDADSLELSGVENGAALSGFQPGQRLSNNPFALVWTNAADSTENAVLLTATFTRRNAADGAAASIAVSVAECYNQDYEEVPVAGVEDAAESAAENAAASAAENAAENTAESAAEDAAESAQRSSGALLWLLPAVLLAALGALAVRRALRNKK